MSNRPKTNEVHRLLDMVVEEVSLVDRAANGRRFLLVKRDVPMGAEAEVEETDVNEQPETEAEAEKAEGDSVLNVAVAALESLTALVELLGTAGGESDPRVAQLAEQLRTTAEQILESVDGEGGGSEGEGTEGGDPAEETSKSEDEDDDEGGAEDDAPTTAIEEAVATAKQALAKLGKVAGKGKSAPAPTSKGKSKPAAEAAKPPKRTASAPANKSKKPSSGDESPDVATSLGEIAASLKTLTKAVQGQQQRLSKVEKQVGLPRSVPHEEETDEDDEREVSWPLDMNQPLDRASVDKSISFHDV